MFEKLGRYLNNKFTAQDEEPDKDDFDVCSDFEPDGPKTFPNYYSFTDLQAEKLLNEAEDKDCRYYLGVQAALITLMSKKP